MQVKLAANSLMQLEHRAKRFVIKRRTQSQLRLVNAVAALAVVEAAEKLGEEASAQVRSV
jgi:HEAT repeat protein